MESFSEDTLFNITSYLTSQDILNLALTCRHFGGKPGSVSNDVSSKKRKAKNNTTNAESSSERQWSLMEEMAKRRIDNTKKDTDWQEKWKGTNAYKLTRRTSNESWIRVDNCIQKMSTELVFSRFIGNSLGYVKKNPSHIQMRRGADVDVSVNNSIAICQDIMTEGRHYALLTVTKRGHIKAGIFALSDRIPFAFRSEGTVIGLILDFDENKLKVYVDGEMKHQYEHELVGRQFRWEVSIMDYGQGKGAVKIERGYSTNVGEVVNSLTKVKR